MKMRLLALLSLVAVLAGFSSCGKTETSGGVQPEPIPENLTLTVKKSLSS